MATQAQTYVPQDTPEVAAAKAAHFAELAKAGQAAGVLYYPRGTLSIGTPVVTADGFIADTPEVAAAKAAHFALKDQAAAAAAAARVSSDISAPVYPLPAAPAPQAFFYSYPVYKYAAPRGAYYLPHSAPAAAPVYITPDGFVADTPEVSAAKIAHYHAYIDRLLGIS